ncbi:DUF4864 domain-containing protein [Methylobacterium marchantiae]|uniref:DUF4864 domain-containing protein n=1 Tax=Methylobacterium marchantiae TaxID=600331 RepID=A0ABW3X1D0_9HYPH|nr:hypothetical protein AIGOOFII_4130 [Methylobacterium marchantiae]
MRAVLSLLIALVCLTAVAVCSPARAADDAAKSEARATVERQIEAFRKDDAATAYAQAAPSIQGMFTSPDNFIEMVRKGYAAVYRARSFSIDRIEETDDEGLALGVKLQDENGVDWVALYSLEKQTDGAWRISGCRLVKAPGSAA